MNILEIRIAGRFQLLSRLSSSSFCELYEGINVHSHVPVAIKIEDLKCKYPQLLYEAKILQNLQGGLSIPSLHWCGPEGDYNVLIMDLLGPSLGEMLQKCGGKFSLKTVLMLADMLINNIEYVHGKGYLHRDVKPENFLLGKGKNANKLFTIDFGLSKKYKDPKTQEHIQYRDKKPLIGTARYASLNTHKGIEQSRRDDLEAIGFMLVYFLKGRLPWQGLKGKTKEEKYNKIKEEKLACDLKSLCKDVPKEFLIYMEYCRNLNFDEKPNYRYLKKIFHELFRINNLDFDYIYDWILIPYQLEVTKCFTAIPFETNLDEINNYEYEDDDKEDINEIEYKKIGGSRTERTETDKLNYHNQMIISQRNERNNIFTNKNNNNNIIPNNKNKDCVIY